MIFEACVVLHPTKEQAKKEKAEQILKVMPPFVAKNEKVAAAMLWRQLDVKDKDLDRVEIKIRPFCR